ncbi:hypothetical protein P4234_24280 [Pseudomonas aeruginosa]|nr:hypothetical protein [Pseudomonas aeruginosa]
MQCLSQLFEQADIRQMFISNKTVSTYQERLC